MSISVLVPFTSDEPWRVRARNHVVGWYRHAGFDVTEGACPPPWRKAVAVADAARRTSADVLVVADADCICTHVAAAIRAVWDGAAWAIPHGTVHRLDETATEAVYAGAAPEMTTGRTERPYQGFAGGGIVVLRRAVWDDVPLDPRFSLWGQEDEAWALALTTLCGVPWRGRTDPLWHLFHPPAPRLNRHLGSANSKQLLNRYSRAARAGRPAMRALLDETRPVVTA